ncbi:MAG: hypothetical protein OXC97_04700 [Candidatus Dadabacteria bacterium]|nr:hypothetical protein [Candidatus Dadabacteria bacterium]
MVRKWDFYGRSEELGTLLAHMRRGSWFFGSIRGRRRIGKTALIQQALNTLREDPTGSRAALLVQIPDSNPSDFAAVFRNAVLEARLADSAGGVNLIRDLPKVAASIGALCRAGAIVVLDEFQVCHRGPLRGFPSLLHR